MRECFGLSGWIKIVESCAVFCCLMLHRIGNQGSQIFYAATDQKLDSPDMNYPAEVDAEILGGAVLCMNLVSPFLLLAYAMYGTDRIQSTSLDALFCVVGAGTLIALGGMTCFAWNHANENNNSIGRRDFESAGALGIMLIATGILYFLDFFWVVYRRLLIGDDDDYVY